MQEMTILGIGNTLQYDDGVGVYATAFLKQNYHFSPPVLIKEGGVAGMALLDTIEQTRSLIILDSIEIDDDAGSIYAIPTSKLGGYGINSGGAHEVGVLECLDMLELQGKTAPNATVIGIVPQKVDLGIALSDTLQEHFDSYIQTALNLIENFGFKVEKKINQIPLEEIINSYS